MRPKKYKVKSPEEKLLRKIYLTLKRMYEEPDTTSLFSIQLLFILYAAESGFFGDFPVSEYLTPQKTETLLKILGTPPEDRDCSDILRDLPYIGTGLFDTVEVPETDPKRLKTLIELSKDFSIIVPSDFSAFLESFISTRMRQEGGSFYTSRDYIHRVIDPLFVEDLTAELEKLESEDELIDYIKRLSEIIMFDPACGTGNFLIESYMTLKELEDRARDKLRDTKVNFQVSPEQLYGIEINPESAVIARSLLSLITGNEANIYLGNALSLNWEEILPKPCTYIIGNPPFLGARVMSEEQKREVHEVFGEDWENLGNLDYVSCWFKKAYEYVKDTQIQAAFLSTSSIAQGESVYNLWKPLLESGLTIDFAYQSFHWKTISRINTGVYCVVIGFSTTENPEPRLYSDEGVRRVSRINGYLEEGENISIKSRRKQLFKAPAIGIGNKPVDGGNYLFTEKEMESFLKLEPGSRPYFYPFYGSIEFIKRDPRYCLYLRDCPESKINQMPKVKERIERVRDFRLSSKSAVTRKMAGTPKRFHVENVPDSPYLIIPRSTTEKRDYIPIGFMEPDTLCSDAVHIIPDASLYHFGVLTSSVHMEWVRAVGGRIGNGYRYSKDIVYNNFPWPHPSEKEIEEIKVSAAEILKIREEYRDRDLATLYDRDLMPEKLKKAHILNDQAVLRAYGLDRTDHILSHLFERYAEAVQLEETLD